MTDELSKLNCEVRDTWNANADYWDERMAEGNSFHEILIKPAQLRLLGIEGGEEILDIACGNGQFSRTMSELGAKVLATDVSNKMIINAKARTPESYKDLDFQVLDATNRSSLTRLGKARFDAVVCTMALFDMADITLLIEALPVLLKPKGKFVFSIIHPAFNSPPGMKMTQSNLTSRGRTERTYSLSIYRYRTPEKYKSVAMEGQPELQHVFHRSLSDIFNIFFDSGLVLDGIEEPLFEGKVEPTDAVGWFNFEDIPPVLVARMVYR